MTSTRHFGGFGGGFRPGAQLMRSGPGDSCAVVRMGARYFGATVGHGRTGSQRGTGGGQQPHDPCP